MKTLFILLIVTSCWLIPGCHTVNPKLKEIQIDRFTKERTLEGEPMLSDIGNVILDIADSLLIIKTLDREEIFRIYETNTFQKIGAFGRKGKGPGEFNIAWYLDQYEEVDGDIKFWIMDRTSRSLQKYGLKTILSGDDIYPEEKIIFPPEANDVEFAYILPGDSLATVSIYGGIKSRLNIVDLHSGEVSFGPQFPQFADQADPQLNWHFCRYQPGKKYIISVMNYFKRIDVINFKGYPEYTLLYKEYDEAKVKQAKSLKDIPFYYFNAIETTDNYFFALCLNQPRKEFYKMSHPVEVHVFDWTFKPLYKLYFNEYLSQIAVDANKKVLYGLNPINETVYRYSLNFIYD